MGIEFIYLIFLAPAVALVALLLFCTQHVVRDSVSQSWRQNTKRCLILVGFGWFCIAFSSISFSQTLDLALGGSAINGEQRGSVYYVGNHGRLSEVSETQYQLSRRLHHIAELTLFPARIVTSIPLGVPVFIGIVWYAYGRLSDVDESSQYTPEPRDAPKSSRTGFSSGDSSARTR